MFCSYWIIRRLSSVKANETDRKNVQTYTNSHLLVVIYTWARELESDLQDEFWVSTGIQAVNRFYDECQPTQRMLEQATNRAKWELVNACG